MTNTIESFVKSRISDIEKEYEARKSDETLDAEHWGYYDGALDAYHVIINHIESYSASK